MVLCLPVGVEGLMPVPQEYLSHCIGEHRSAAPPAGSAHSGGALRASCPTPHPACH